MTDFGLNLKLICFITITLCAVISARPQIKQDALPIVGEPQSNANEKPAVANETPSEKNVDQNLANDPLEDSETEDTNKFSDDSTEYGGKSVEIDNAEYLIDDEEPEDVETSLDTNAEPDDVQSSLEIDKEPVDETSDVGADDKPAFLDNAELALGNDVIDTDNRDDIEDTEFPAVTDTVHQKIEQEKDGDETIFLDNSKLAERYEFSDLPEEENTAETISGFRGRENFREPFEEDNRDLFFGIDTSENNINDKFIRERFDEDNKRREIFVNDDMQRLAQPEVISREENTLHRFETVYNTFIRILDSFDIASEPRNNIPLQQNLEFETNSDPRYSGEFFN